ncbi:Nuf2 family-domain-containing protein [Trichophaea hybrida]|nr:Nuf2 family-domain-containing protein [Trichophaea hybrida]
MAYNSRQSNMFRLPQPNAKIPSTVMSKKLMQHQHKQLEHDLSLEANDIIACLTELGIQFYAEDLKSPTALKVQYLFEKFVSELMGVNKDSVEPIVQAASQKQEFPDAHHEAGILMAFYCSLTQLMMECGVRNFSFNDILKPESVRLRHILSNVINFLRFRAGRMDLTEGLVSRGERTREAIERLVLENDELTRRVHDLTSQRQREEPAIERARKMNQMLTDDLRNFKKKQAAIVNGVEKVKVEKRGMVSSLQDIQYLIETNQRECNKLQPYIVDSPDQLQQVIVDLGQSLSKEREAVDIAERQARALQTSADSFDTVEVDVSVCIKLMEDCQKELFRHEEHARKLQRHQESLHQKETEVKEIERKDERLLRTLKHAEEKLARAREQAACRREAAKREMEVLKLEYISLSEERARTSRDIDKKNTRIDIKQKEMADLKATLEEEITLAKAEYERLSSHIDLYMSKMDQQISSTM